VALYKVNGDATSTDFATNQGGGTLQNVHLQVIFWGSQWANAPTSPATVMQAINKLVSSTYFDQLKQYGLQSVDVRGSLQEPTSDPPATFTDSDVDDFLSNLLDNGPFAWPDEPGGDNTYLIMMPPGANEGDAGSHSSTSDYDPGDWDYAPRAWIAFNTLDIMTETISHELAETISDPVNPNSAWLMEKVFHNDGNEIGDACNGSVDFIDGVLVQGYWSQSLLSCVIPFAPPPTITMVSPNQGPQAGGQKVIITGTNFDASAKITFAGVPALSVQCNNSTCSATTPPGQGVEDVLLTVNHFTAASPYLFGPYPPNCSAAFTCLPTHVGATTITCPGGLAGLTLQRFDGTMWAQVNNATETATTFVDPYAPPPSTEIDYQVTLTDSDGTAVSAMNPVYSHDCACFTTVVCQLPGGGQIYPQPKSPPNWCSVKGGHLVSKTVPVLRRPRRLRSARR
jgi:hypothetical protein